MSDTAPGQKKRCRQASKADRRPQSSQLFSGGLQCWFRLTFVVSESLFPIMQTISAIKSVPDHVNQSSIHSRDLHPPHSHRLSILLPRPFWTKTGSHAFSDSSCAAPDRRPSLGANLLFRASSSLVTGANDQSLSHGEGLPSWRNRTLPDLFIDGVRAVTWSW